MTGILVHSETYTDGLEFSYILPVNDQLSIDIPVKIGLLNNDPEGENISIIGLDAHANYHFRSIDRQFRPYALVGLGGVMEGMDSVNLQIPIGGGIDNPHGSKMRISRGSQS